MTDENENWIKLDQFLKYQGVAATGGQAKLMIQDGEVEVNGEVETRRGRKLVAGDRVTVAGRVWEVKFNFN
ncbi:MAG TPA: RNA-binding S4 domain-containing protein [Oscillatoriaceae cyanobacterium M33_DOE_052]|uniref:RNA-binding S4 domain-containing protein n=1 Tax=Planktothricoides sp. SpSt-374 TaxID=2282167 RepID=A0A7C3VEQ6_9CYAN|nr:RNA-binding S4 domain-containing protein [Oscillatoriaceae cyanobacterium M33_DOE_052]